MTRALGSEFIVYTPSFIFTLGRKSECGSKNQRRFVSRFDTCQALEGWCQVIYTKFAGAWDEWSPYCLVGGIRLVPKPLLSSSLLPSQRSIGGKCLTILREFTFLFKSHLRFRLSAFHCTLQIFDLFSIFLEKMGRHLKLLDGISNQ